MRKTHWKTSCLASSGGYSYLFFWQSGDFVVQVVASRVAVHWDEPPHVPQHAVHEVHAGREGVGLDGLTKASGGE